MSDFLAGSWPYFSLAAAVLAATVWANIKSADEWSRMTDEERAALEADMNSDFSPTREDWTRN